MTRTRSSIRVGSPPARVGLENRQAWLATPALLWILLGLVVPLTAIVVFSFWTGSSIGMSSDLTTSNYANILTSDTFWGTVRWTFRVLIIVLLSVTLLGLPVAYFTARVITVEWIRTGLIFLLFVPFLVSYIIRMITWIPLFGRAGIVNWTLTTIKVLDAPSDFLLYTSPSMITALVFLYVAFMVGPVYFKLQQLDKDLIRAAQNLGASPLRTFLTVELPLIRPGIVIGWLFVSVMIMSDFATERIVGGGLSPMLAGTVWRRAEVLLWPQASAQAVTLVILTLALASGLIRFAQLDQDL
ncbi:MAG: ABC transporter permease [Acidimicrobiales bacterium]|nr:ABC transporter permease [Acidimicrobiales bacterium]